MNGTTQLGRYRILGELGRGAMGVVYRAEDPVLDRQLAIKTVFVSADDADRSEYEARFTQEARAAGKLAHPGIVTIYDVGREGGVVYMAMELLEGVDLRTQAATSRFSVAEAASIVERVADALSFAHDRGVVHRDIKPPNIMLLGKGRIKIMDFGIARMRSSDLKTQTGLMMGTPRYMSPEQVAGRPVDQRSDIFSLGTVLYELLTGTNLFTGNDATEVMYNVAQLRPVPTSRINRQVPPMLDLVVARALEKDANERYQDAHQFAADLRACLNELGVQRTDVETTQRLGFAPGRASGGPQPPEKTERLEIGKAAPGPGETTLTRNAKPQNIIVDSNTRLAVSHIFDSTLALQRLTDPERKDHARLIASPHPSNFLVGMWRDLEMRILIGILLAAAVVGLYIAAW
ncbi:MAG TPA: serine/threonine-protein kinase [Burkholderiales bacterium]|nr:serine/threonine-protein kinase [Burkholderiales bacterium]